MDNEGKKELQRKWAVLVKKLSDQFNDGEKISFEGILFLIGVQELGLGLQTFSKEEKTNLLHIAVCEVLIPFGHYQFAGKDKDGWPHYEKIQNIPYLSPKEQSLLLKEAVVSYFEDKGI